MNTKHLITTSLLCFAINAYSQTDVKNLAPATKIGTITDTAKAAAKKPTSGIADKIKSCKKHDGLFTIYQDTVTGSTQLYVKKEQIGKEFIYQSFSISGPTELYLNQSMHRSNFVFKINKVWDKIEFLQVNLDYSYDKENPVSKTALIDKTDAIFYNDKIVAEDSDGYLINTDGLFISEKLDPIKPTITPGTSNFFSFNLGMLNPMKSKYNKIRSFANNTDVVVDMAYDNPLASIPSAGVTDPRYVRITMQHSFIEMPKNSFVPRFDDHRIGYFTTEVTNLTTTSVTPFKDVIHKWHLEKKDKNAALSEPVKPIVWYLENTTPHEYRQTIIDAGLKWNEAFEKAGFKNAVEMRIMPDTASWDPADINYNVIRWVASPAPPYGAIGPSFVNPRTGEILGSDITVEWFSGSFSPSLENLLTNNSAISFGTEENKDNALSRLQIKNSSCNNHCTIAQELKAQYTTGITTLQANDATEQELTEMHKQFLTYLIMHEMGHTMGLNHNMKASQMLSPTEANNKELTRRIGNMASVMDYPAVNVALDKSKQGDYYTTKAGPYDMWAIEYGYKPFNSATEEKEGLNKILSRSNEPYLIFGNDGDDMRSPGKAIDPRVNVNDFSNDMPTYAEDRYKLVNILMPKLLTKYIKNGQSYQELRTRYSNLCSQRYSMSNALSRYIGGVYIDRSQPEQKSTNKPMTPVPLAVQKRAMDVMAKYVLAPNAFDADAVLYPYLQRQRRGYDQGQEDYKITDNTLRQQVLPIIAHILHPNTLLRMQNSQLYGNQYSVADMLNDLQKACFDADINGNINTYRQYLQTTLVKSMTNIANIEKAFVDEVSAAAIRYSLKKLRTKLTTAVALGNEASKAHKYNLMLMIDKALNVK